MPTPPLCPQVALAAFEAYQDAGNSYKYGAASIGVNVFTFQSRVKKYKEYLANGVYDKAIQAARSVTGASIDKSQLGPTWVKTGKDGEVIGYSQMVKPLSSELQAAELIEAKMTVALGRAAAAKIPKPAIHRSKSADHSLWGFIPVFDAHLGGGFVPLQRQVDRIKEAYDEVLAQMPECGRFTIMQGGDFTTQNDASALTPASKHPQDTCAHYEDVIDAATDLKIYMIERAAAKCGQLKAKSLRGNHDPHTAQIIRAALRQRYRAHDSIEIDLGGVDFWHDTWGRNFLIAHHGDWRRGAKDLALSIAKKYRAEIGATDYHECHTGHLHHIKESRIDIGALQFCQHPALGLSGRYEAENIFDSQSFLSGIVYRESGGRKATFEEPLSNE